VLVVVAALQSAYYAPRIPEILGSHFGRARFLSTDGKKRRWPFFSVELIVIVLRQSFRSGFPPDCGDACLHHPTCQIRNFLAVPEAARETFAFLHEQLAWLAARSRLSALRNGTGLPAPTCTAPHSPLPPSSGHPDVPRFTAVWIIRSFFSLLENGVEEMKKY